MKFWQNKVKQFLEYCEKRFSYRLAIKQPLTNKYVAFCDLLGFSNAVLTDFDKTADIYKEFREEVSKKKTLFKIELGVYSDSIIIVGDDLIQVAQTAQILQWTTLRHGWLVRGGIAHGKHWKESDANNLYIVSEALVKAVSIEKKIKHPIIAIDSDILLDLKYWIYAFNYSVFDLPIIHYNEQNIIMPFNNYWFKSAEIIVKDLKHQFPDHKFKYDYLLKLIESIKNGDVFIPQTVIDELIKDGVVVRDVPKGIPNIQ